MKHVKILPKLQNQCFILCIKFSVLLKSKYLIDDFYMIIKAFVRLFGFNAS